MLPKLQTDALVEYFFTYSETIDFQLGKEILLADKIDPKAPSPHIALFYLEQLENVKADSLRAMLALNYLCINHNEKIKLREEIINEVRNSNGFALTLQFLNKSMLDTKERANMEGGCYRIGQEWRTALNLLFLIVLHVPETEFQTLAEKQQLEDLMFKGVQFSLEIPFIPMRKLTTLFVIYVRKLFSPDVEKITEKKSKFLSEAIIESLNQKTPRAGIKNPNAIEYFYKYYVMTQTDNPLAQVLVVGLLRALLTTCSQASKSTQGLDLHREWEDPYKNIPELLKIASPAGKEKLVKLYAAYQEKDKESSESPSTGTEKPYTAELAAESERHRLITANSIASLLNYLLKAFRKNDFFQYLYLTQLISDANGVLVLLKFLTDKFTTVNMTVPNLTSYDGTFNRLYQDTILKIMKLMYSLCEGHPEKIKTNLMEYNAYFVIKKIPGIFEGNEKLSKYATNLLKMQTRYFTKKMRQIPNNMKIISEIYCKNVDQSEDADVQSAELKFMLENFAQEDIRKICADFNQYNYWDYRDKPYVDKDEEDDKKPLAKRYKELYDSVQLPEGFEKNYEKWLEENVWDYYD